MPDDLHLVFADGDLRTMEDGPLRVAARYFTTLAQRERRVSAELQLDRPVMSAYEAADACYDELASRSAAAGDLIDEWTVRRFQAALRISAGEPAHAIELTDQYAVSPDLSVRRLATESLVRQLERKASQLTDDDRDHAVRAANTWLAAREPGATPNDMLTRAIAIGGDRSWPLIEATIEQTGRELAAAQSEDQYRACLIAFLDVHQALGSIVAEGSLTVDRDRAAWTEVCQRAALATVEGASTLGAVRAILDHDWFRSTDGYEIAAWERHFASLNGTPAILQACWSATNAVRSLRSPEDVGDPAAEPLEGLEQVQPALDRAIATFERGCEELGDVEGVPQFVEAVVEQLLVDCAPGSVEQLDYVLEALTGLADRHGTRITKAGIEAFIATRIASTIPPDDLRRIEPRADALVPLRPGTEGAPYVDLSDRELELCWQARCASTKELSDPVIAAVSASLASRVAMGAGDGLRSAIEALTDADGVPLYRWRAELDGIRFTMSDGEDQTAAIGVVRSLLLADATARPPLTGDPYARFRDLEDHGVDIPELALEVLSTINDVPRINGEGLAIAADELASIASDSDQPERVHEIWRTMGALVRRLGSSGSHPDIVDQYRAALGSSHDRILDGYRALLDFDGQHGTPFDELPHAPPPEMTAQEQDGQDAPGNAVLLQHPEVERLAQQGQFQAAFAACSADGDLSWEDAQGLATLIDRLAGVLPTLHRSAPGIEFQLPGGTYTSRPRVARRTTGEPPAQPRARGTDGAQQPVNPPPSPRRSPRRPEDGRGGSFGLR